MGEALTGGMSGGASGGGGGSGDVDYPDWIKYFHQWMLADKEIVPGTLSGNETYGIMGVIKSLHDGSNPLSSAESYDPDLELSKMQTKVDEFGNLITNLNEEDVWDSHVNKASQKADAATLNTTEITALKNAFEVQHTTRLQRGVNRISAGMDMMKAINVQWLMALASQEKDLNADVAKYDAELKLNNRRERIAFISAGISVMAQLKTITLEGIKMVSTMQTQVSGAKLISKREQGEADVRYDIDEALWDLRLYQEATGVFSSIGGATIVPRPPDRFNSMIGGMLSGAAQLGSLAMPFGAAATGLFSIIGGALGAISTDQFLQARNV